LCRAKSDKHSSPAFFKSMSLIGGEGYEGRLNYGILDCDLPLPSNKTTLERFNLTVTGDIKKALPMFYVANGQPPKMLPHGYYATAERADALLKFVLQATKSRGWRSVKDAKGLRNCIKKKNCAVVLYPGKVRTDDDGGKLLDSLADRSRLVNYVVANSDVLGLSIESEFPDVNAGVSEFPRVVLLKHGPEKTLLFKAHTGHVTSDEAGAFISKNVADPSGKGFQSIAVNELFFTKKTTMAGQKSREQLRANKKKKAEKEKEEFGARTGGDDAEKDSSKPQKTEPRATPKADKPKADKKPAVLEEDDEVYFDEEGFDEEETLDL